MSPRQSMPCETDALERHALADKWPDQCWAVSPDGMWVCFRPVGHTEPHDAKRYHTLMPATGAGVRVILNTHSRESS
jgi:hypothetical protein